VQGCGNTDNPAFLADNTAFRTAAILGVVERGITATPTPAIAVVVSCEAAARLAHAIGRVRSSGTSTSGTNTGCSELTAEFVRLGWASSLRCGFLVVFRYELRNVLTLLGIDI